MGEKREKEKCSTKGRSASAGVFSFFSGAGFLDLGFELTDGFEVLFVNEFYKPFLEAHEYSRQQLKLSPPRFGYDNTDINLYSQDTKRAELKGKIKQARRDHEIIGFVGGPPCPDFSVGGKNRGRDGENGRLSGTYIDLICETKPDFFLFENVKGLWRTKRHRLFYEELKKKLHLAGFVLTERLINSLEYGVAQDRERIVLIGFSKNSLKAGGIKVEGDRLTNFPWLSYTRYTMDQINAIPWSGAEKFDAGRKKPKPRTIIEDLTIEHWFRRNEAAKHPNSRHCFTPRAGLARFESVYEGDDSKKSFKRLHRWRYSPTAAYGNNEVHLHPYLARRISVAEALSIQSLPKEFQLPPAMTLTDMFKTVGNGVPFLAAKGLAKSIKLFLEGQMDQVEDLVYGENDSEQSSFVYQPTA
jgi:DNA (cytosine-5)-methyltransferase 1